MDKALVVAAVGVALAWDLPPDLFTRLIYAESRFDPKTVSSSGCVGLGQINIDAWPLETWIVETDDPYDPYANLMQAAHILKTMMRRYGYDFARQFDDVPPEAVAAYTLGHGAVDRLLESDDWDWEMDLDEPIVDYIGFVAMDYCSDRWGSWWWADELPQVVGVR